MTKIERLRRHPPVRERHHDSVKHPKEIQTERFIDDPSVIIPFGFQILVSLWNSSFLQWVRHTNKAFVAHQCVCREAVFD